MKKPLKKSRIPENKTFVIKELIAPYFDVSWHFHSEYQLFIALKGRGTRFVGDHMKTFREGDMVLTGPNLPHLWRNDNEYFDLNNGLETHGIVIYFPEDLMNNSVFKLEEFESIAQMLRRSELGLEITGETNQIIRKLMQEMIGLKGGPQVINFFKILHIISESNEVKTIVTTGYTNTNKESEKDRMGQVYEYVMNNFKDKVSLEKAAEIANLSPSAFSRFFKSRVNKSFSEFLIDIRISHACKLLNESELNISEISYECGYFTLSNFNKQFKEKMGKTPLAYRKDFSLNY
ncbi:AraC family transcriptional regulator [Algoriphagus sp. CAU 1675]|uniref:AraC family transcriptional regulator n=1 Tax=Algoriphagus sp. CAU 1675 TaxID=3032597 RepID=UPI0023DC8CE6|nr:AraC family transcriptional regulator [Algoriphagus sp. CAU 1675]MDF2157938.1 AraC family transcriptional regulator [Algoriphagus sp. CAU 1675]